MCGITHTSSAMGCGASSAKNGNVVDPEMIAAGPNSASPVHEAKEATQAAVPAADAGSPVRDPVDENLGAGQATSPNSTAKLSGAATPVLGVSSKAMDEVPGEEGGEEGDEAEEDDDLVGSLHGESRLLNFDELSLQDRVNQLASHVHTQNLGKTYNALKEPLPGNDDDSDDMDALYDLPANPELDESWRNKIFSYDGTGQEVADLSEIMAETRWAKEVQLKSCKIDLDAVKFLDKVVQDRELRSLTFARCNLEDDATVEIAKCLSSPQWASLHTLGFDGNQMIGDASAEALAQALINNTSLHELSLWGTGVQDAGAKSLANALRQNSTLKNLWLGECEGITDEGATALKDALAENAELDQLALIMTSVSEQLQDDIEQLVVSRREQRALSASQSVSSQAPAEAGAAATTEVET